MALQPEFEASSYTDIGKIRQTNEDYYSHYPTINGDIFVVCDGMGGHVGGATAARMAAESIRVFFEHQRYENPIEALRQSFLYANSKVHTASQQSPELEGMGTTCVAMLVREGTIYYAHVGDSRLYRLSSGRLQRLTRDHTYVQQLIDRGELTIHDALMHPRRHELTRALGVDQEVEVDISQAWIRPEPSDTFLLCTDGLSGVLTDDNISQVLSQQLPASQKAERLVLMANNASGADNVTAQVIAFQSVASAQAAMPPFVAEPEIRDFGIETPERLEENSLSGRSKISDLNRDLSDTEPAYIEEYEHPNPVASTPTSITDDTVKKNSTKPDIALIVLCGLVAITIGLFITGWKYLSSDPVENSELTTIQANTATDDITPDEEDNADEAEVTTEQPAERNTTPATTTPTTTKTPAPDKAETPKPKATETPKTTPVVAAGGTTVTHVVKAGETFTGIANRYNLKYETLKALNPQISNVEKDLKSDVTKLNVKVKAVHTVGPGDIMSVVSKKYGVSKELIMAANKKTADRTERGEKLTIPLPEKQ